MCPPVVQSVLCLKQNQQMTLALTNYIAGSTQLLLCVFLIIWLGMLLVDDGAALSFAVGEYSGDTADNTTLGRVPLSALVGLMILFTLITGLTHILVYARASPTYVSNVNTGNNWVRWTEYAITATIMMFIIAVICGVGSVDTLILLATASLCCMLCGLVSESTARSDIYASKIATLTGWLLMIGCFGVIMRRFGSIVQQTTSQGLDGPPSFVWAIVIGMAVLYLSFGVIHLVHMRKQWSTTDSSSNVTFNRRIEKSYTIASVISKILLVVLVASGLFARDTATSR